MGEGTLARPPKKRPMGVRLAERMTGVAVDMNESPIRKDRDGWTSFTRGERDQCPNLKAIGMKPMQPRMDARLNAIAQPNAVHPALQRARRLRSVRMAIVIASAEKIRESRALESRGESIIRTPRIGGKRSASRNSESQCGTAPRHNASATL